MKAAIILPALCVGIFAHATDWVHVYAQKKDVPDIILNADPRAKDISPNAMYEVSIGLHNDGHMGDDRGFTYGHYMHTSMITSKGMRFNFNYNEDLYTKNVGKAVIRPDGLTDVTQKTNVEKIMEFVVSNREQGHLLYYSAGIGWQQLDPSGKGFAADVQRDFHKLIKDVKQVINIDGGKPKNALMLESAVGIQGDHNLGDSAVAVAGNFEAGVRYSGLQDASFFRAQSSGSIMYKADHFGTKLTLGVDTKVHVEGFEYNPYAEASLTLRKKTTCAIRATQPKGDIMNYQQYNLPNFREPKMDLIWTTSCTRKF